MADQLGVGFAELDWTPRWRERLPELAIPALAVHGRRDPFFPVGNGGALAVRSPAFTAGVRQEPVEIPAPAPSQQ